MRVLRELCLEFQMVFACVAQHCILSRRYKTVTLIRNDFLVILTSNISSYFICKVGICLLMSIGLSLDKSTCCSWCFQKFCKSLSLTLLDEMNALSRPSYDKVHARWNDLASRIAKVMKKLILPSMTEQPVDHRFRKPYIDPSQYPSRPTTTCSQTSWTTIMESLGLSKAFDTVNHS